MTARSSRKARRLLHHGVGALPKERLVRVEGVVLPEMQGQPSCAKGPQPADSHCRAGRSQPRDQCCGAPLIPGIRSVLRQRGARAHACARGDRTAEDDRSQSRRLGTPVVHLRVDVDRELRVPRRHERLVPDTLQVRRESTRPAAPCQEIAPVLDVQPRQARVVSRLAQPCEAGVGRQLRLGSSPNRAVAMRSRLGSGDARRRGAWRSAG